VLRQLKEPELAEAKLLELARLIIRAEPSLRHWFYQAELS
jgi:hypothetical protein